MSRCFLSTQDNWFSSLHPHLFHPSLLPQGKKNQLLVGSQILYTFHGDLCRNATWQQRKALITSSSVCSWLHIFPDLFWFLRKNDYLRLQRWYEVITVSFYLLAQIFFSDARCANRAVIQGHSFLGPKNETWPFELTHRFYGWAQFLQSTDPIKD